MKSSLRPENISLEDFRTFLGQYESLVPATLQELERLRLDEIPGALTQRKERGPAFLTKDELTALVEWKLKHGKFRPNLAKLAASNSESEVKTASSTAFAAFDADPSDLPKALTTLAKLRGIGPATASLLLSCYDPATVPFFADELFLYVHWEERKGVGWDRKIGYTMKEYKALVEKVDMLRDRLNSENGHVVLAVDIEKVAYVLKRVDATGDGHAETVRDEVELERAGSKRKKPEAAPSKRKRRKS